MNRTINIKAAHSILPSRRWVNWVAMAQAAADMVHDRRKKLGFVSFVLYLDDNQVPESTSLMEKTLLEYVNYLNGTDDYRASVSIPYILRAAREKMNAILGND